MLNRIAFSLIAFLAFLLEMHITTIPFVVGISIVLFILYRQPFVFLIAFLLGLLLDLTSLMPLGSTSLMLIVILFLVSLYQRKFEIKTSPFVFFATLLSSLIFLIIQHEPSVLQQALLTAGFSVLWYRIGLTTAWRSKSYV